MRTNEQGSTAMILMITVVTVVTLLVGAGVGAWLRSSTDDFDPNAPLVEVEYHG